MKIAVDTQGADRGVAEVVVGAHFAVHHGIDVILFGPAAEIEAALDGHVHDGIEIVDTPVAITNHEDPAIAARRKTDSSIVMAAKAVAEGRADALVSAGPTGATLAASLFHIRRIKGVKRPGLAVFLPNGRGDETMLLDAGANVDVPPEMLVQFATLGAQFWIRVMGVERPKVGLLTIGEEDGKGNDRIVAAGQLLADPANHHGFEFVGNVEGRDITTGELDVVVTDGFTGNVALKSIEGAARATMLAMRDAIKSGRVARIGGLLARRKLLAVKREIDPDTTGGALLLGVRNTTVVAHGSSSYQGVASAIALAARAVEADITGHIAAAIAELDTGEAAAAPYGGDADPGVTVGASDDA